MSEKNKSFEAVKSFHLAFGHTVNEKPTIIPDDVALKRAVWVAEELVEFLYATAAGDTMKFSNFLNEFHAGVNKAIEKSINEKTTYESEESVIVAQADALTDIAYFNYGSFVVAGIEPQPLFDIVQKANMAKLGKDGKPIIRESDGKIMKPEGWMPPEPLLEAEIKKQMK